MNFKEQMLDFQQYMDSLVISGENKGIVSFVCDGESKKKPMYCVNISGDYRLASMAIARVLCGNLPVNKEQKETLYVMMRAAVGWFVEHASVETVILFFNRDLMKSLDARFNELAKKYNLDEKDADAEGK